MPHFTLSASHGTLSLPRGTHEMPRSMFAERLGTHEMRLGKLSAPHGTRETSHGKLSLPRGTHEMCRGKLSAPHVMRETLHGKLALPCGKRDLPRFMRSAPHVMREMPHLKRAIRCGKRAARGLRLPPGDLSLKQEQAMPLLAQNARLPAQHIFEGSSSDGQESHYGQSALPFNEKIAPNLAAASSAPPKREQLY